MNNEEWDEIVAWVNSRYPNGWKAEQNVAYYDDLARFDISDVWSALFTVYGRGLGFPPNGSQIMAQIAIDVKGKAEQARYDRPALPEPVTMPVDSWLTKWYPDETVSWTEHIRLVHATRRCESRFCDIHSQEKENSMIGETP